MFFRYVCVGEWAVLGFPFGLYTIGGPISFVLGLHFSFRENNRTYRYAGRCFEEELFVFAVTVCFLSFFRGSFSVSNGNMFFDAFIC